MRLRDVSKLVVRLAGVLLGAFAGQVFAQSCDYGTYPYEYYNGSLNGGIGYASIAEVCAAFVERDNAAGDSFLYGLVSHSTLEGSGGNCTLSRHLRSDGTPISNVNRAFAARAGTICMPPPPVEECDSIGQSKIVTGPPGQSGTSWCEGVCRYRISFGMCGDGGGSCDYVAEIVSSCGGAGPGDDPPDGPPEDVDDGGEDPSDSPPESCVDVGDGEYCIGGSGPGDCGYFNDVYTCIGQVREDECKVAADGSRLCGDQVKGTPPAPDSGTPGEVATPDGTVTVQHEDGSTTTYNYYSSGTVAGSSRDPGTTGANAASGAGSPHAPSQGDADGDGQGDCNQVSGGCGDGEAIESNGPCYAEGEGALGVLEACGTAAFDELRTQVTGSDFYVLVTALSDSVPSGGACPSAGFSAFGEDYDFGDVACELVEDAGSVLSVMFYLLWSLIGLRILMGAFGGGE